MKRRNHNLRRTLRSVLLRKSHNQLISLCLRNHIYHRGGVHQRDRVEMILDAIEFGWLNECPCCNLSKTINVPLFSFVWFKGNTIPSYVKCEHCEKFLPLTKENRKKYLTHRITL